MRVFKIKQKDVCYGYLFLAKGMNNAYIELIEGNLDYPVFFNIFVGKGEYTINSDLTKKWILERVIPYERQNIAAILKENNLKAYNEYEMFVLAKGKSSMDDTSIEEVSSKDIDKQIIDRHAHLIQDFIFCGTSIIVFFKNGKTKQFNLTQEYNNAPFLSEFRDEIVFSLNERLSYLDLYKNGIDIKLSYDALKEYLANNLLEANDVAELKGVTKQNISLQKRSGKITPIKDKYFLKNDVL